MTSSLFKKTDRTYIGRTVIRNLRAAAMGILACAFLAPFGATAFLQTPVASCGIGCCTGSHCCCRTGSSEIRKGPQWSAVQACPDQCAQHMGLPGSAPFMLLAGRIRIGYFRPWGFLRCHSKPTENLADAGYTIFGRSPPFHL